MKKRIFHRSEGFLNGFFSDMCMVFALNLVWILIRAIEAENRKTSLSQKEKGFNIWNFFLAIYNM